MTTVFVSHAHGDFAFVEKVLLPALREEGLDPWYSKDDIAGGAEWERQIKAALDAADLLLVVLSPRAAGSKWVRAEVAWGLHRLTERVVTVLIEECRPADIHMRLEPIHYIDFRIDRAKATERLRIACRSLLDSQPKAQAEAMRNEPNPSAASFVRDWEGQDGTSSDSPALSPDAATSKAVLRRWIALALKASVSRSVPFLLWCLAHSDKELVGDAEAALTRLGINAIDVGLRQCADARDMVRIEMALAGLDVVRSRRELVRLLDRLIDRLSEGRVREKATSLLERKRVGLEIDDVSKSVAALDPRLRIERALGQGQLATSYAACDLDTGDKRVVRILQRRFADQPQVRARFLEAARRSSSLSHHNLVLTRETKSDYDRGLFLVVRDYVGGATLREVMDEYSRTGQTFTAHQIVRIVRQMLLALMESNLHRRLQVHGGIRPGNIFLLADDQGERIVIGDAAPFLPASDLGLATRVQDFLFVAPEVLLGESELAFGSGDGIRYDLYAIGCLAYELFCGRPPVMATNVRKLIAGFDKASTMPPSRMTHNAVAGIDDFLMPLLAREPTKRVSSFADALASLDVFVRRMNQSTKSSPVPTVAVVSSTMFQRLAEHKTDVSLRAVATVPFPLGEDLKTPPPPPPLRDVTLPAPGPETRTWSPAETPGAVGRHGHDPSIGLTINDRYLIERMIGIGGMGRVYLASDLMLKRRVAVKLLAADRMQGQEAWARFEREARILADVNHAAVVKIYDIGTWGDSLYLVLPFLSGGSLDDRLRRGMQSADEVLLWLEPIANALDHLHHKGLVHRDVKPHNILFDEGGNPFLADFGVSRTNQPEDGVTQEGLVIGTPRYMAPEQFSGRLSPASDQYALGVTVIAALRGGHDKALGVDTLIASRGVRPSVPMEAVSEVSRKAIEKATALDPTWRFPSCSDFATAFRVGL